ncbi:MAG: bifunctional diaminohydroxyphosphoribosylaminopyrimidine deaminase/5-amino-6-(5-phosphoribosylamino)uracil reductase RibD, partial [Akkermansiaceae bacterium]|nr:bifunctional diaminohydroxyphosphoribosylaminopyrimidine deaminase/5-amino-6-(5-phosphoribosylamino)uracil reductase RibD [Verrucomicrobiales bacterium]
RGGNSRGATLYVTLEPCCTQGRTPPCTGAIIAAGIKRVVVGATDPNPNHAGKGFTLLQSAGIEVLSGVLAGECAELNEAFNHWIVSRTPFVTVKAAMTLDGKIATASGESKWITGELARACGMKLRQGSDAILVGVNTILNDDPSLTRRDNGKESGNTHHSTSNVEHPKLQRIILDSLARTPLTARVVTDEHAALTTIVVSSKAPKQRVKVLSKQVQVLVAPLVRSKIKNQKFKIDLAGLLQELGRQNITSLLVEGGGEVNASFLLGGFAQRVAFFYAPKILGGRDSKKAVAGEGVKSLSEVIRLENVEWKQLGSDLLLTAKIAAFPNSLLKK